MIFEINKKIGSEKRQGELKVEEKENGFHVEEIRYKKGKFRDACQVCVFPKESVISITDSRLVVKNGTPIGNINKKYEYIPSIKELEEGIVQG